jgi:hypothetical protein
LAVALRLAVLRRLLTLRQRVLLLTLRKRTERRLLPVAGLTRLQRHTRLPERDLLHRKLTLLLRQQRHQPGVPGRREHVDVLVHRGDVDLAVVHERPRVQAAERRADLIGRHPPVRRALERDRDHLPRSLVERLRGAALLSVEHRTLPLGLGHLLQRGQLLLHLVVVAHGPDPVLELPVVELPVGVLLLDGHLVEGLLRVRLVPCPIVLTASPSLGLLDLLLLARLPAGLLPVLLLTRLQTGRLTGRQRTGLPGERELRLLPIPVRHRGCCTLPVRLRRVRLRLRLPRQRARLLAELRRRSGLHARRAEERDLTRLLLRLRGREHARRENRHRLAAQPGDEPGGGRLPGRLSLRLDGAVHRPAERLGTTDHRPDGRAIAAIPDRLDGASRDRIPRAGGHHVGEIRLVHCASPFRVWWRPSPVAGIGRWKRPQTCGKPRNTSGAFCGPGVRSRAAPGRRTSGQHTAPTPQGLGSP